MSVARAISLVCDHEEHYGVICGEEISRYGGISIAGLALMARREGWVVKSPTMGPHFCPEHAKDLTDE